MDDTWLQEPARSPSRNTMLNALWEILNVWRKKMRFNWKGASWRLNPKAARNSPNLSCKRALLLPRADMLDDGIRKRDIKRVVAEGELGCIADYGCEAIILNRAIIQDVQQSD